MKSKRALMEYCILAVNHTNISPTELNGEIVNLNLGKNIFEYKINIPGIFLKNIDE